MITTYFAMRSLMMNTLIMRKMVFTHDNVSLTNSMKTPLTNLKIQTLLLLASHTTIKENQTAWVYPLRAQLTKKIANSPNKSKHASMDLQRKWQRPRAFTKNLAASD
jgi:hypothetical protein